MGGLEFTPTPTPPTPSPSIMHRRLRPHLPEQFDCGMVLGIAATVLSMGCHVCYIQHPTLTSSQQLVHLLRVEQLQPARRNHLATNTQTTSGLGCITWFELGVYGRAQSTYK